MSKLLKAVGVAALGLILGVGRADAGPVLYIDDANNQLGTVDVGTGAVTVIGPITPVVGGNGNVVTDIAFSPTGQLYGITFDNLYRVNRTTGAATLVGSLGAAVNSGANALVFAPNGTLYLAAFNSTSLYTVNPTTGAAALVGNIGFASAGDLAFNGGNLYLSDANGNLIRVNPTTGAGTLVGNTGFTSVFGLATGDNGVLYGVAGTQIFSVNTTTGAGTLVRNYSGGGLGTANGTSFFAEAGAVAAVPEPLSVVMFGGLVGIGGLVARRRRIG